MARPAASDDPRVFGPQELVVCALKAHQAYESAPAFAPLLGRETAVLTAMNGIPWWYFHKAGGAFEGRRLQSVDPGDRQWCAIGPERAIGCVVEPACEVVDPGVVVHHKFKRFILGEPDGVRSARIERLSAALTGAGFEAPIRDDIRWNIWLKLWGNVCFNPISALTGATIDVLVREPALRALCRTMMLEAKRVNEALGVNIPDEMVSSGASRAARLHRRAQDVDAPGSRARALAGDRCARDCGPGTRPFDADTDSDDRCRARAGAGTRPNRGSVRPARGRFGSTGNFPASEGAFMTTAYITHPDCLRHEMGAGHPENPERLNAVNEHMKSSGLLAEVRSLEAPLADPKDIKRVHRDGYVDMIFEHAPKEGYVQLDPDTAMNPYSFVRRAALRWAPACSRSTR